MSFEKKQPNTAWRKHLTADEVEALAAFEREARELEKRRGEITAAVTRLRNRGYHRWRAAERAPPPAMPPAMTEAAE